MIEKLLESLQEANDYPFLDDTDQRLEEAEKPKAGADEPKAGADEPKAGTEKDPFADISLDTKPSEDEEKDIDPFRTWVTVVSTVRALNKYMTFLDLLLRRHYTANLFNFQKKVTKFQETLLTLVENWDKIKNKDKIIALVQKCSQSLQDEFKTKLEEVKNHEVSTQ
jgi:Fe-S oxidoreductase